MSIDAQTKTHNEPREAFGVRSYSGAFHRLNPCALHLLLLAPKFKQKTYAKRRDTDALQTLREVRDLGCALVFIFVCGRFLHT